MLLAKHGDSAKILAGGQSLVPILNFRLGRYDFLIDINRIDPLSYIRVENDMLCLGAMTRQRVIESSALVLREAPLLARATKFIAHLPIRTRGTIGGSLAHADPAAEYPAIALALDAEMVIRRAGAARTVAARDFFLGPLETALELGELLVEIRVPVKRPNRGYGFDEVSRRRGDFALVGAAASVTLNGSRVGVVRIAICGLESGPVRVTVAEQALLGSEASRENIRVAARQGAKSLTAQTDLHATADYRLHLAEMLMRRALDQAVQEASEART